MDDWSRAELLQLASIAGGVLASVLALVGIKMVRTVHVLMNSRLTQLLDASTSGARAEGVTQGRAEADQLTVAKEVRQDARDDRAQGEKP